MKNYQLIIPISLLMMLGGCDDVELAVPGNNQDLDPQPPVGGIEWAEGYEPIEDGGPGRLEENSAAGFDHWSSECSRP